MKVYFCLSFINRATNIDNTIRIGTMTIVIWNELKSEFDFCKCVIIAPVIGCNTPPLSGKNKLTKANPVAICVTETVFLSAQ